jgi:hypothetical protein
VPFQKVALRVLPDPTPHLHAHFRRTNRRNAPGSEQRQASMASFFLGSELLVEHHLSLYIQAAAAAQTSADAGHPSPNDLSAAAILATLADSRPPTSHGAEEEELDDEDDDDDDQTGGILLADESQGVVTAVPYTMTAAGHVSYSNISEAMHAHTSGNYLYYEMDPSSYDVLDQHAAALEALSMEPLPALSSMAPSSIPDQLMTLAPMNQHELDVETSIYEAHLSAQNKETFMDITNFVRRYVAPFRPVAPGLEDIRLPDAITREDLQGDSYDFQGIDWESQHCTRASVREQREMHENARMQPKLRQARKVYQLSVDGMTIVTDP